jgi:hypothetical protein
MRYNFCRIHKTLRVTPAMEAGIADRAWTVEEITDLYSKTAIFLVLLRDRATFVIVFQPQTTTNGLTIPLPD